jgi:hypothetical protein
MYQTSDWIKAITRLSKLTVEGALAWQSSTLDDDELPNPTDRPGRIFTGEYKDRRYRVFEVSTKAYTDEDTFYWASECYLDIFVRHSPFQYEFVTRSPSLPVVADLFRTVERKYAYQKGALIDLLDADEDSETE